ncbi:MAG: type III pantothenate kinase, partial [Fimbriimonadaceae bacterium]
LECVFLKHDPRLLLEVTYQPPTAVGADRLANALGALARFKPPIIVVDFGTATTFDAIDSNGTYIGGAILPGVMVSTEALVGHTAKLPQIEFRTPDRVIGRTTTESLQSGIVLGYAGAIDSLAKRMNADLGGARIIATGGLGSMFLGICETIESHEPNLTLEGLAIAWERLC